MKARLVDSMPSGGGWIYEIKFDGYRALALRGGSEARLLSRNQKDLCDKYEDEIRPGTSWQTALGQQIESIKSAAIFVGESGLGPWQNQEIQALLSQFVKRQCPVIPTVLPSAKAKPDLPWMLGNINWVDFRVTDLDPLDRLVWGITGEKPQYQSHASSAANPTEHPAAVVKELLPPKEKVIIELRLPGNLDAFSTEEQLQLVAALKSLYRLGDILLTRTMPGSIRLHLELSPEDADKIYAATKGQLADLGISEVRLYPPIAVPPEGEQRPQLLILLDRVKQTWVDGVLRNSIHDEALIALGKSPIEEAVEPPWKHVVELASRRSGLLFQDRNITTIFDATGLLLIMGEPGSGKTTTLLELAATLVTRAKVDAKERVPFVLNLSTWRSKQPLGVDRRGAVGEISSAGQNIAFLVQNDYLLPLLDVTADLHFRLHWFGWLIEQAPDFDLVCIAGDLLDMFKPEARPEQARQVRTLIRELADPVPIAVCSGNHDNAGRLVSHDRASVYEWFISLGTHRNVITDGSTRKLENLIVTTVLYHCSRQEKSIWLDRGSTIRDQTGIPWIVLHHVPAKAGSGVSGEESEAAEVLAAYEPDYFVSGHDHGFP